MWIGNKCCLISLYCYMDIRHMIVSANKMWLYVMKTKMKKRDLQLYYMISYKKSFIVVFIMTTRIMPIKLNIVIKVSITSKNWRMAYIFISSQIIKAFYFDGKKRISWHVPSLHQSNNIGCFILYFVPIIPILPITAARLFHKRLNFLLLYTIWSFHFFFKNFYILYNVKHFIFSTPTCNGYPEAK